jgi:hypothetical protein
MIINYFAHTLYRLVSEEIKKVRREGRLEVDLGRRSAEALSTVLMAVDFDHRLVCLFGTAHSVKVIAQFRPLIFQILLSASALLWSCKTAA